MLFELKCEACDAILVPDEGCNTYYCKYCGSRYVFADEDGEIINVDELIKEGYEYLDEAKYRDAFYCFDLYVSGCKAFNYEAYLGYILSKYECRKTEQLSVVGSCEAFECDEWKRLVAISGENAKKLMEYPDESVKNFRAKMKTVADRSDSEIIDCEELYLMYIPEYRNIITASDMQAVMGTDAVFDTIDKYYLISCTASDKTAEYYLPAIKEACKCGHSKVLMIVPEPSSFDKTAFVETMFEYHMSNDISLVLAFVNDFEKIKRIFRYSKMSGYYEHYDVPKAQYSNNTVFLQGNRIVLINGNVKYANNDNSKLARQIERITGESVDPQLREQQKAEKEEQEKKKEAEVEQRAAWIRARKCRHCGGDFVGGLFSKTCCLCGKRKDY